MTPNSGEMQIQRNTIALLKSMGYTFISQEEIKEHRTNTSQVLLKDILLEKLQSFNGFKYKGNGYTFSPKNIAKAIDDLDVSLNEGLMTANQKISDQLLLGNSYVEELIDGVQKSFPLFYIDYEHPKNNVFHFTEEFIVDRVTKSESEKTRRPDLVLFINGIPFGVIELKKSSIDSSQGISQMIRNQGEKEIPSLFKYVQITLAGNNHSPQYATTGTPEKFYAVWEEEEKLDVQSFISGRTASKLDETLFSLFGQKRVLEQV